MYIPFWQSCGSNNLYFEDIILQAEPEDTDSASLYHEMVHAIFDEDTQGVAGVLRGIEENLVQHMEMVATSVPGLLNVIESTYQTGNCNQANLDKTWNLINGSFMYDPSAAVLLAAKLMTGFAASYTDIKTRYDAGECGECGAPPPQILFYDDFSDGNADGWNVTPVSTAWTVENGEYSVRQVGRELYTESRAGSSDWTNYVLELDAVRPEGVDLNFGFRGYYVTFRTGWYWDGGHNYCFLQKQGVGIIHTKEYTIPLNVWHQYRVELTNNNIKLYVKQKSASTYNLLFDYTDNNNPILSGGINLYSWSGHAALSHIHYDNIRVTELR